MQTAGPHPIKWTSEEYYRLSDENFFLERRVELLNGEILVMPRQTETHVIALSLTSDALRAAFGPDFWVRYRGPLDLSALTVLDPDIAVVAGSVRSHTGNANPTTALLVVEVSDESTMDYDKRRKARVYAVASVADFWIVNLVERQLEVYRDPAPDRGSTFACPYTSRTILGTGDAIAPLAAPTWRVAVADLLP